MADALDSKSSAQKACGFESHLGHLNQETVPTLTPGTDRGRRFRRFRRSRSARGNRYHFCAGTRMGWRKYPPLPTLAADCGRKPHHHPPSGTAMWSALWLGGALALGQPPLPVSPLSDSPVVLTPSDQAPLPQGQTIEIPLPQLAPPAPIAEKPAPPATPPPDRWAVMRTLQGTWYGAVLDDGRVTISGWTEGSFTASTARVSQLPMGFNYRANDFLLQNNWL